MSPIEHQTNPMNSTQKNRSRETGFLVQLDQASRNTYRSLFQRLELKTFDFNTIDDAISYTGQAWPSIAVVHYRDLKPWARAISAIDECRLFPDLIVLVNIEDYLEKDITNGQKEEFDMETVLGEFSGDIGNGPMVIKTVLHPTTPQEIMLSLESMLIGRRARVEHLNGQRTRALYKKCADLAFIQSRKLLLSIGLDAVVKTSSSMGGAVLQHGKDGFILEYLSGMENIKLEKTLDYVHAHIPLESTKTEWVLFPHNYKKGKKTGLDRLGVILPVKKENHRFTRFLVFPGRSSRWPRNKTQDVELLLTHIRLALKRVETKEEISLNEARDPWTGLLEEATLLENAKKSLIEHGKGASEKPKPEKSSLALILTDLDGFTQLNQKFGHLKGSFAIRDLARRLVRIIGKKGVLGRTGPDEFAAVVENSSPKEIEIFAGEIRDGVWKNPIKVGSQNGKKEKALTVTVGYVFSEKSANPYSLLHKARNVIDQARREGGNKVAGLHV